MSWQPLFLLSTVVSQWWMAPRVAQSSVSWGPMLRSWRRTAKASLFSWQPRKKASEPRHRLVLAGGPRGWGFLNSSTWPAEPRAEILQQSRVFWQLKTMYFNPLRDSQIKGVWFHFCTLRSALIIVWHVSDAKKEKEITGHEGERKNNGSRHYDRKCIKQNHADNVQHHVPQNRNLRHAKFKTTLLKLQRPMSVCYSHPSYHLTQNIKC